jgi:hypothetical protein
MLEFDSATPVREGSGTKKPTPPQPNIRQRERESRRQKKKKDACSNGKSNFSTVRLWFLRRFRSTLAGRRPVHREATPAFPMWRSRRRDNSLVQGRFEVCGHFFASCLRCCSRLSRVLLRGFGGGFGVGLSFFLPRLVLPSIVTPSRFKRFKCRSAIPPVITSLSI